MSKTLDQAYSRYEDNAAGGQIRTELAEEVLLRGANPNPDPNPNP